MADNSGRDDLNSLFENSLILKELEKYKTENQRLTADNQRLTVDLMRQSATLSDYQDIVKRWQAELEIVASKGGHNLCHIWIPELLLKTIGHASNFPDTGKMTKCEFKLGCKFYQDDIYGPDVMPPCLGPMFKRRAVFFDRDGTLVKIIERPYHPKKHTAPFKMEELEFVPGVQDAVDRVRVAGFLAIMVTNQPDVAHGYMEEENWQKIQKKIEDKIIFDGIYICRHRGEDGCDRKKPLHGMLYDAADNRGIDLPRSYMVGDSSADILAGKAAGCTTILLDRDYNDDIEADFFAKDLVSAVDIILDRLHEDK